jgi:5-methylcytosine-specific restriction endonuclease McrA
MAPVALRGVPPSLASRVANVTSWVQRLVRWVPVTMLSVEVVRFDTQKLQHPEIRGIAYQHGALFGYELGEYLLLNFHHTCAYCHGASGDPILEVEYIVPKSRGGTDWVSNLAIACRTCNQAKGNRTAEEFGHPEVHAQVRKPLRHAAAVNSTRWALWHRLRALELPVETGAGGRTKHTRTRLGYPKAHWIDAACVGESGARVQLDPSWPVLTIRAMGDGKRQRCGTDKQGFPIRHAARAKRYRGFGTGDLVRAQVPRGESRGRHWGHISIRHRPSVRLSRFDIHRQYLHLLQRADGYGYAAAPPSI